MNQMQALQDPKYDRPTGIFKFLWGALLQPTGSMLLWPYQEQEKDKGWKRRGTNPQVPLCFTFSIQIYSANANKRSWGKKKSLSYSASFYPRNTVLPYAEIQA